MFQIKHLREFNGNKLKLARNVRNITLQELADYLGLKHQSISKYENNKSKPSPEMIKAIADKLSFQTSFFFTDEPSQDYYNKTFIFRSKAGIAKKYIDQSKEQIWMIRTILGKINENVNLPRFNSLLLKNQEIKDEFLPTSDEEIELLAAKVRHVFNLGDGPIGNLTALCEKLGVIISFVDLTHNGIDACSVLLDDRPYIVLNNDRTSAVRIRFNIAHELGHLLLHSNYSSKVMNKTIHSRRMEYEANRFAAALLMPESGISKDISALGLDFLLLLKRHWKVSLQAIIYRAEQLELFTSEYSLYLRQQISRKKWRSVEPLDDEIPIEQPKLIMHALKYLDEKLNVSLSQLSFETGIKEKEIIGYWDFNDDQKKNDQPAAVGIRRIK